ncbi:N-acetylmuramidase family protein [Leptobacterium sp. I13]|uniref:N-acetylmuramidase family protein n=1 Tax=Leptobacterium meishanense TaxID=3128904 RepID=UPI0030EF0847
MKRITEQDYIRAAQILDCEVAVIKAVADVESRGSGFNRDGTPKTLFEGHWFHKFTDGKFTGIWKYRSISYPRWTRVFYGNQTIEKKRLSLAASLDREAALKSCSWGKFQIMGFNYDKCGFRTVQEFVNAMYESEGAQLQAFVNYIKNRRLDDELRDKNWSRFAYYYNGSGYRANKYDVKLEKAYLKYL